MFSKRTAIVLSLFAFALATAPASRLSAQLLSNPDAPVRIGHYHLNVTSVEAHKKFWVDTLGGKAMKFGASTSLSFPTRSSSCACRSRPARHAARPSITSASRCRTCRRWRRSWPRRAIRRRPGASLSLARRRRAAAGTSAVYGRFAYFLGPDGAKIELVTAAEPNAPPIVAHHIHFINKQYVEMQQWYMKAFDATLRSGQTDFFIGADLPGVGYSLNFFRWEGDQTMTHVPTAGRVVDHVDSK